MNTFVRDLSHGFRVLKKTPAASLLMIGALGVGIGMNTAMYSFLSALILHPLPYPHLQRIMIVEESVARLRDKGDAVSPANFRDFRDQSRSAFQFLAAFRPIDAELTGAGEPERLDAVAVSADFFPVFGLQPALGRVFRDDEMHPGRAGVAVVSNGFWQRRMAADPSAIGRTILLNGRVLTIIGVMPEDFNFPLENEVWVPLALDNREANDRRNRSLAALGLLKPGVPLASAREQIHAIALRLAHQYPDTNEGRDALLTPIRQRTNEGTDRFTSVLMITAGFVLLLACVNIGNMQLTRAVARQREMAVRTALGAGRWQIVRQLLIETLLLAVPGAVMGLLLASFDLDLTRTTIPAQVLHWVAGMKSVRMDGSVVVFTIVLSFVAAVLCMLPAMARLISGRQIRELNESLKDTGRSNTAGAGSDRLRRLFAVCQIALALVLLIAAGLMVRTFRRMLDVSYGFDPKNILTMQVSLGAARYPADAQLRSFSERAVAGMRTLPGVRNAAVASSLPGGAALFLDGRPDPRPGDPRPAIHAVSSGYFETLRLPIQAGRGITDRDGADSPRVVVVAESVARHYWPGMDPVGQRIRLNARDAQPLTVAGVCGDLKDWFSGNPAPTIFIPLSQAPQRDLQLLLRTDGDPMQLAGAARTAIHRVDPAQPVFAVKSEEDAIAEESSGVRAAAISMSSYALVALLLAISGVYSVVSFSVAQRTHEFGIRMALGADPRRVVRMTLAQALRISAVGLAIGIPAAIALTRLMASVLYNTIALDASTFVALAAALALCSLIAGYLPARRAAATDPVSALRHE